MAETFSLDITAAVRQANAAKDAAYWQRVEQLVAAAGLSLKDVLRQYPAFIMRRDLPRILAHYELFKLIQQVPGSIAECGVFQGAGMFTWANLLETFCPGDRGRKVFGFDHFQGYANDPKLGEANRAWMSGITGDRVGNRELVQGLMELHSTDSFLPGVDRCVLIDGDLVDTLPRFVQQGMGVRLSLLYIDVNLYDPTFAALTHLYPLVVPGGVVAFTGYGNIPWEGESKAFEDYFADGSGRRRPKLNRFPFSILPSAWFIKE